MRPIQVNDPWGPPGLLEARISWGIRALRQFVEPQALRCLCMLGLKSHGKPNMSGWGQEDGAKLRLRLSKLGPEDQDGARMGQADAKMGPGWQLETGKCQNQVGIRMPSESFPRTNPHPFPA